MTVLWVMKWQINWQEEDLNQLAASQSCQESGQ
jgi:hypothetical protein